VNQHSPLTSFLWVLLIGRGIQQPHSPLFGKIQKENKVLQQVRRNDRNLVEPALEETEQQQNHTKLAIPSLLL